VKSVRVCEECEGVSVKGEGVKGMACVKCVRVCEECECECEGCKHVSEDAF